MSAYLIRDEAVKDLEKIWIYTFENWSVEQADRYYGLIIDEIGYLTKNFESGTSMDHIKPGYRASKVKSHLIFYRNTDDETLEIIRILHQQMDVKNRIND